MSALFHCISEPGAAVELWLARIPQDRQQQRLEVRAWMQAELASRDPGQDVLWQETSRGPLPEGSCWRVSVSYSGAHVLCGLSCRGAPGVDLAKTEVFPEILEVASLYCGPKLAMALASMPAQEQGQEFARAWSLLEARQKACGIGLQEYSGIRDARLAPAQFCSQIVFDELLITAVLVPLQPTQAGDACAKPPCAIL